MPSIAPYLAEVAQLVGDPARANILAALMDGGAATASDLAIAAHVSPQTTSSHLRKLTDCQLLRVAQRGRYRYYRLASPLVAQMLERIMDVASIPDRRRQSRSGDAFRIVRTCYDHLAGRVSVAVADALIARRLIVLEGDGGEVRPEGLEFFASIGIDLTAPQRSRRAFCRPCLDWSERRFHVAGHVGAAIMRFCFDRQWFERHRRTRALTVTAAGRRGLGEIFHVDQATFEAAPIVGVR